MAIDQTFTGFVETTTDALLIFEACRRGILPKISRRLQDKERGIIRSGAVFVFDEKESGIKRWTDGFVWSPSRILGNFLIYRELHVRQPANNKSNLLSCSRRSVMSTETSVHFSNSQPQPENSAEPCTADSDLQQNSTVTKYSANRSSRDRNLVGSLTDSYKFRKGGLIKKTISIHLNGSTQHLVSYYNKLDVVESKLATPSVVPELSALQISTELLLKQSFRVPPSVEFAELIIKRPSLSPSSTNSTITCCSMTPDLSKRVSHTTDNAYTITYTPQSYYPSQQSLNGYPMSVSYVQTITAEDLDTSSQKIVTNNSFHDRCMPGRSMSSFAIPSSTYFNSSSNAMRSSYSLSSSYMSFDNENDRCLPPYQASKLIYPLPRSEYAAAAFNNQPGYTNKSRSTHPLTVLPSSTVDDIQERQKTPSNTVLDQRNYFENSHIPAIHHDYYPLAFSSTKESYEMDSSASAQHPVTPVAPTSLPSSTSNEPLWQTSPTHKPELLATTTLPYA